MSKREQLAAFLQACPYVGAESVPERVKEWYGYAADWLLDHGLRLSRTGENAPAAGSMTAKDVFAWLVYRELTIVEMKSGARLSGAEIMAEFEQAEKECAQT